LCRRACTLTVSSLRAATGLSRNEAGEASNRRFIGAQHTDIKNDCPMTGKEAGTKFYD